LITSTHNSKVKEIRRLQAQTKARRKAGAFVVEGVRLCEEAVLADWEIQYCLYTPDLPPRGQNLIENLQKKGISTDQAAEHVIKTASDTQTPQGIMMVVTETPLPVPEQPGFVLILDKLQDPGNQGTLLRTAAAAGADLVLIAEGSADVFSPKVLRSGMGAHFRLPIRVWSEHEIIAYCRQNRVNMWAAILDEGPHYTQAELSIPSAVIIGSEAHGVSPDLRQAAQPLHIPMPGSVESLNAAAAGAILIYEVLRQKTSPISQ
jgi:TrmH family RNA methyltransferase